MRRLTSVEIPRKERKMQQNEYQEQIARLKEQQDNAIKETDEQIHKWTGFKSDYEALKERLTTLPDQVSHDVMVPFGKMAFIPGKLVHSNEILVLLGDNWFAERSAKQAVDIVNRRMKEITKQLEDLDQQRKLIEPRRDFTSDLQDLGTEGAKTFEIREEYDEENERKWKEQHRKEVRKYKHKLQKDSRNDPKSSKPSDFDENLWARLDELEKKEREGKELQNIGRDEHVHDSSQYPWKSGPLVENAYNKTINKERTEELDGDNSEITDTSEDLDSDDEEPPTDDSESSVSEDDTLITVGKVINFSHTAENVIVDTGGPEGDVIHPGMVYTKFYANKQPKSILKKDVPGQRKVTKRKTRKRVVGFDTGSDTDEQTRTVRSVSQSPSVPAFTGAVVEKTSIPQTPVESPNVSGVMNRTANLDISKQTDKLSDRGDSSKPVSRFKARKQNKADP